MYGRLTKSTITAALTQWLTYFDDGVLDSMRPMWMPEDYVDYLWQHLGNKVSDEWNDNELLRIGGALTKRYVCYKRGLCEAWQDFVKEAKRSAVDLPGARKW